MDRGSFEAMAWLGRVLSSLQFSKLQVGLRLTQIGLRLGLVLCTYYLFDMNPFYFWKVHLVTWRNNRYDSYFRRHIEMMSI